MATNPIDEFLQQALQYASFFCFSFFAFFPSSTPILLISYLRAHKDVSQAPVTTTAEHVAKRNYDLY